MCNTLKLTDAHTYIYNSTIRRQYILYLNVSQTVKKITSQFTKIIAIASYINNFNVKLDHVVRLVDRDWLTSGCHADNVQLSVHR